MTTVDYRDIKGNIESAEEMYKVIPTQQHLTKASLKEIYDIVAAAKEKVMREQIEKDGGIILSAYSEPISNRRYKRKTAKVLKRMMNNESR